MLSGMANGPTLRRRRLARELSRLRVAAGLTLEDAAGSAGISTSHLSRLERAQVGVRVPALKALLGTYGLDASTAAQLVEVARDATQRGWWHRYAKSIPDEYTTYIGFEADAESIWNFELAAVPGLLQTEEYARAILRGGVTRLSDDEIERRVEVRVRRQRLLGRDDPPTLWIILDEAVIRRQTGGPKVMAEQLNHLGEISALPNVDIQVVPFGAGAHPGTTGSFVVLRFADPDDREVVYLETMAGDLYPETDAEIGTAILMFDRLRAMALSPDDSVALIREAAEELN
jgi:transcriptional regulator with XRE-family HTH domain